MLRQLQVTEKIKVVLLHGMNISDGGAKTTDKLVPYLEELGYEVSQIEYGWFDMIKVRLFNHPLAEKLVADETGGGSTIYIGHSNGAAIIARAIDYGLQSRMCLLIHPALKAEWTPPDDGLERCIKVFYSHNDKVGLTALVQRHLSPLNWLFGGIYYGAMMRFGSTSQHSSFTNINDGFKHSEGFEKLNFKKYLDEL